ncbi:oligoendopeptidase F [Clostridium thermobutyricum]|uniref:Oligopeptidase F n=1 Tax=Clostridium thermobutyricum DSM 4928 TaxID=1121339 RepID=A0A1V4SNE4_9CLOT|nr:oligoendopeptidase F [Clostridium thermobutyricum]OPX45370.1 oligoendopeptidase F, plasmid [Clostridium thermobutyricum DSM 4928]
MEELKKRSEIKKEDKWDIEKIYKNSEEWEKAFETLKKEGIKIKEYEGKLNDSETLLEFLKLDEKISREAEKILVYSHLKSDENTGDNQNQGRMNKADSYMAELSSYGAFFIPEILSIGEENINKMLNEKEELKLYDFMFKSILAEKDHVLSKEIEEMLASVSDCLEGPSNIHGILTNADMTFPKVKNEKGELVRLTEGNYASFIRSKDVNVRREAFKALFNEYTKIKNTLGTTLTSSIKNFNFMAKTRKYSSALEASLKPNNIPVKVYEEAIETINKHLPSLHRYVRLKKKLLGLEEMHMYDLYVPVIEIEKEHIEFDKAVEIVIKALEPLGEEYLDIFKSGIKNGWIDKYENEGKRGGAYSWGTYDTMPYVLLNYNYDLNDVSTLAHEMGHSIHSYYSHKEQPYIYGGYTLFCAEVASTTNESLLINYLIRNEKDKNKRLYLINQELEQIRTTVFRQLMFAEFEYYTHKMIEEGNPLTAEDYCKKWHELNVNYFGEDMIVDEEIDIEWARIPHFYSDFYVYQYATGYAAASAFSNSILNGEKDAVSKYKKFLKSGGSDYPINILRNSGVDMTTPMPLEKTIKRFNELLDMLENEI